jgi:hypothetical protein
LSRAASVIATATIKIGTVRMSRTPSHDRKYAILLPVNRVFAGALAVDEIEQPYP